ncbi:tegument protein UL35 [Human betaherpesvirus 5]|nr:tegument protein UL35 [Human betaherpesvirus 5]
MAQGSRAPSGPPLPVLPVDDWLNFRVDLFGDEHRRLLLEMLTQGCSNFVGLLNFGVPSPVYALEALVDFQVRNAFMKVKPVAQEIIRICILANHYRNSRDVLRDLRTQLDVLYSEPLKTRLLRGLIRLCRAAQTGVKPEDISVHLGADDVTFGVLKRALVRLHRVRDALGLRASPEAEARYPRLTTYNLLFHPPPFTTVEAVDLCAENLSDVTQRRNRPLRCLTSIKRPGSRTLEDALNDMYLLLTLRHLQLRHALELQMMQDWVVERCNRLCDALYFCYTQAPETRQTFVTLVRGLELARQHSSPAFQPMLYNLLQLLTQLHEANVYLCPGYLHFSAYKLLKKIQSVSDARERGEFGDEDEEQENDGEPREAQLDLEADPTAREGELFFFSKNLYGNGEVFRVPEQPSRYLRRRMFVERPETLQIFYNFHEGKITTETYHLQRIYSMMIEGASRQTGLTPKRFMELLDRAPLGQGSEPEITEHRDLFADVFHRPVTDAASSSSASSSSSSASPNSVSLPSARSSSTRTTTPASTYTSAGTSSTTGLLLSSSSLSGSHGISSADLEQPPRQRRRMVSVTLFSPYSVAYSHHRRHRRRRSPPPAPRGPAHTRFQGPDSMPSTSYGSDVEDPRDDLAENLRHL